MGQGYTHHGFGPVLGSGRAAKVGTSIESRGFFVDYNASPETPLDAATAELWRHRAPQLDIGSLTGLSRGEAATRVFRELAPSNIHSAPTEGVTSS